MSVWVDRLLGVLTVGPLAPSGVLRTPLEEVLEALRADGYILIHEDELPTVTPGAGGGRPRLPATQWRPVPDSATEKAEAFLAEAKQKLALAHYWADEADRIINRGHRLQGDIETALVDAEHVPPGLGQWLAERGWRR